MMWNQWKKGFYAWENATAEYLETVLKNPSVLGPSGQMLQGAMKGARRGQRRPRAVLGWLGPADQA